MQMLGTKHFDKHDELHVVLQLVGGLYAKICPLKMASDYVNMMPKDQGNVTFPLSIGMILR